MLHEIRDRNVQQASRDARVYILEVGQLCCHAVLCV